MYKNGQICTKMDKYRQIWTKIDRLRHIPKSKANHSDEPTAASCKNTEISMTGDSSEWKTETESGR